MTWFGWLIISIEILGLIRAWRDPEISDKGLFIYTVVFMLLICGVLFIGTGSLS